jgi:hypothetical protein
MELIVLLIGGALLIGLFIRNKGDNTMDTLSKGCGCIFWFIFILIAIGILVGLYNYGILSEWTNGYINNPNL